MDIDGRGLVAFGGLSKTKVDQLGERLKKGPTTEDDLRLLDELRRSYTPSYGEVVRILSAHGLSPTGRPAKSTVSIVEKLKRETIRLSQMQDIAGCRVIVEDVADQNRIVEKLRLQFSGPEVIDRRTRPSHGYRAVHVVPVVDQMPIEVQVRTELQHTWAEISEKVSDLLDPSIKYGGGSEQIQGVLVRASKVIADLEELETDPLVDHTELKDIKDQMKYDYRRLLQQLYQFEILD